MLGKFNFFSSIETIFENLEHNSYLAAVPNYLKTWFFKQKIFYQNKIIPGTQQFLVSVSIRYVSGI